MNGGLICLISLNLTLLLQNFFFLRKYNYLFNNLLLVKYDRKIAISITKKFSNKILISWGSNYFISNGITPLIFKFINPTIAGKFGLSWSLLSLFSTLSKQFILIKRPLFGKLISENKINDFYLIFKKSYIKSFFSFLILSFIFLSFYWFKEYIFFIDRLLVIEEFFILILFFLFINQLAYLTFFFRAQFKEPLYKSYLLISLSFIIFIIIYFNNLSVFKIIISLIIFTLIIGYPILIYNLYLFKNKYRL